MYLLVNRPKIAFQPGGEAPIKLVKLENHAVQGADAASSEAADSTTDQTDAGDRVVSRSKKGSGAKRKLKVFMQQVAILLDESRQLLPATLLLEGQTDTNNSRGSFPSLLASVPGMLSCRGSGQCRQPAEKGHHAAEHC